MEKFNFLKLAKISCLVFGLSSIALTSCKEDPEPDGPLPDNFEVPVLTVGDFSVTYPENHTFGAWDYPERVVPVSGQKYKFKTFLTMDTLSKNVRITYMSLSEPTTAKATDVDVIAKVFKDDVYCDDFGHELLSEETALLAGHDTKKLTARQFAYLNDDLDLVKLDFEIYKERYIFFDEGTSRVYSVEMEMPDSLKAKRRSELYGIISSLRINKK